MILNRRIYWINHALKAGNPFSALEMLFIALRKHPFSLVLLVSIDCCNTGYDVVSRKSNTAFPSRKTPVIGDFIPGFLFIDSESESFRYAAS